MKGMQGIETEPRIQQTSLPQGNGLLGDIQVFGEDAA